MIKLRHLRCSFCKKDETEVAKLVAGPRVYICDECVTVARRLMDSGAHDDSQALKVEPTIWRRLATHVRQLWPGGAARQSRSGRLRVDGWTPTQQFP